MTTRVRRPIATWLVLAVASSLAAGCGGGSASSDSVTLSASRPITKTQATAYARAVNLHAADLPDMSIISPEGEHTAKPEDGEFERCMRQGFNGHRRIVDIHSATFGWTVAGEFERLSSAVEVQPTAALTALTNAANRSRRGLTCAKRYLTSAFAKKGTDKVRYGPVTVSRLPNPLPGVDGSFEYRFATTVVAGSTANEEMVDYVTQPIREIPFYFDTFGFISGPVEINLIALGDPRPVSKVAEQRLLSLLSSRAKALTRVLGPTPH